MYITDSVGTRCARNYVTTDTGLARVMAWTSDNRELFSCRPTEDGQDQKCRDTAEKPSDDET